MKLRIKQIVLAVALAGIAGAASAQYIWLDEKGIKQYSDMPPPASVPKKRILKEPGNVQPSFSSAESAEKPTNADTPPAAPMTTAEKNAEFNKRRAEQAEKDKKAAEEAKFAAEKAKNCERAREYQRTLSSGARIARTDKNGERTFLTDEQRAAEAREAQRILDDCK